jgi:hypothetical protein
MFEAFRILRRWLAKGGPRRDRIPADLEERLPLPAIERVTFFKRDELTTDLICCEIQASGQSWLFHEEAEGWDALVRYLERLPRFRSDWYSSVVQPPFAPSETIAFTR